MMKRLAAAVLLMPMLWSVSAFGGDEAVQVFQTLGLLGTWSPDCKREPSADNPRVTWWAARGAIHHTVTLDGRTVTLEDTVGTAEVTGEGLVQFTAVRRGRVALIVTLQIKDEHVHTVRSVSVDGRVYYDHGVDLATGKPSLVDERCMALIS